MNENITIKNNTGEKVWIKVRDGMVNENKEVAIEAGQSITAKISLTDATFYARWHGDNVKAEIISSIHNG